MEMKSKFRYCVVLLPFALGLISFGAQAAIVDTRLCPSKNFSEFLSVFSDSASIQERFTTFPLRKLITVDAEPEPKQEVTYLEREGAQLPILPVKSDRVANGLEMSIVDNAGVDATVKLEKPNTDYQVLYLFKLDSCWFLNEVKDYSL
jgi:hypothetical protein